MKIARLILMPVLLLISGPAVLKAQYDTTKVWTLQDCIEYALDNNISLKKMYISSDAADADIMQAKAAAYPGISFSTGQNLTNRPFQQNSSTVTGSEVLQTNGTLSYTGTYGFNAQWTIFDGFRISRGISQAEISGEIADLSAGETANTIKETVLQLYIQILYSSEAVNIAEGTLLTSEAECDRAAVLLEAGSISESDYAQLKAQVANDRYQLVSARTTLSDYKLQLKQLLEIEDDVDMRLYTPDIDDSDVLALLPDKKSVYETALSIRPEILSGELSVGLSELDLKVAKGGYLPSLSMSAGIGTNHTSGSDYTFAEQIKRGWNNSVGLTLSIPIFSNLQNRTAVTKAELQCKTAALDLTEKKKQVYKEIEGYWLDASSSQQQYLAAKDTYESAKISYDLVSEQFGLGMKNTVELLTEKNNLLIASQQMIQAKYMAVLSINMLNIYSGQDFRLNPDNR